MRRIVFALFALAALPLFAIPGNHDLAADYDAALEMVYAESEALKLYDALAQVQEAPDDSVALGLIHAAAERDSGDAALQAVLKTVTALAAAGEGESDSYKAQVAQIRTLTSTAPLLKQLDLSGILVPCTVCRGDLRCDACRGTGKCPTCKGRKFVQEKRSASGSSRSTLSTSLSASSTARKRCADCTASGICRTCRGKPKSCSACSSTGRMPDPEQIAIRISRLACQARNHLETVLKDEIAARTQSEAVAGVLRKAKPVAAPAPALALLNELPAEAVSAVQWSQVEVLKTKLAAMLAEADANSARMESQRRDLRAAIAAAQRLSDPVKGLEKLLALPAETSWDAAVLEALAGEIKIAFDGLLSAARKQQDLEFDHALSRVEAVEALPDPQTRYDQAGAVLDDLPEALHSRVLVAYAKDAGRSELSRLFSDTRLNDLRNRLERVRSQAETELVEAEKGTPWWIGAAVGGGGLAVLLAIVSIVQAALAKRAEAERKARQKAALDSIRNTFAHRRGR